MAKGMSKNIQFLRLKPELFCDSTDGEQSAGKSASSGDLVSKIKSFEDFRL